MISNNSFYSNIAKYQSIASLHLCISLLHRWDKGQIELWVPHRLEMNFVDVVDYMRGDGLFGGVAGPFFPRISPISCLCLLVEDDEVAVIEPSGYVADVQISAKVRGSNNVNIAVQMILT